MARFSTDRLSHYSKLTPDTLRRLVADRLAALRELTEANATDSAYMARALLELEAAHEVLK